jgi:anaerobic ribonucleoside-triphosphate reductase activating protein
LKQLQSESAPPNSARLLAELDILIDGPFVECLAINSPTSLVSSSNQAVHVFNPDLTNQMNWASDQIEIHILKDGSRIVTGYQGSLSK